MTSRKFERCLVVGNHKVPLVGNAPRVRKTGQRDQAEAIQTQALGRVAAEFDGFSRN